MSAHLFYQPILLAAGVIITGLFACKKEGVPNTSMESGDQKLTKVTGKMRLGDKDYDFETINFKYNTAGKIIQEGSKTYVRDELERIVAINDPSSKTNRRHISIYYEEKQSNNIAYSIAEWGNGIRGIDSTVYFHDGYGRLAKTETYIHQFASTEITTFGQQTVSDTTYKSEHALYSFDSEGNLKTRLVYRYSYQGNAKLCVVDAFQDYLPSVNPQYSEDEIRLVSNDPQFYGTLNSCKNNFSATDKFSKVFEYRKDGRPSGCKVLDNGKLSFTLQYTYE